MQVCIDYKSIIETSFIEFDDLINSWNCRYNPKNSGATDTGFVDILPGDEEKLKAAVATIGPISVAIDASRGSFQLYHEGMHLYTFV